MQTYRVLPAKLTSSVFMITSQLSLTYNNMKFQAPPEFRELLSEVTKTVLEEQPTNIPLFLARYFKELEICC